MTVKEIVNTLGCQVLVGEKDLGTDVKMGAGCDLMSDVLAFIKPGALLLTGLSTTQAIRTAEISEAKVVCLVRGKQPTKDAISLARELDIILLTTPLLLFEACGKLYINGLVGCSEYEEKD
jgi:predicted transcriptional regulator